jgi:two-component system LytT family response regulator
VPDAIAGAVLSPPVTALVVDDERLSRERVRALLATERDVVVVGECQNGIQALDAITAQQPELVFLDIQMPDLDGLGVLDALGCADQVPCPEFIFVTAFNQYWERAFEVHAVDYLRKPYTNARFYSALAHARRHVLARRQEQASAPPGAMPARYAAAAADVARQTGPIGGDGRVVVQDHRTRTWHPLSAEEIDWIETDGSAHVRLHRGKHSYRWRKSMAELEQELGPHGFLRVHRSFIVNGARIESVKALSKGEYTLLLHGGRRSTPAGPTGKSSRASCGRSRRPRG